MRIIFVCIALFSLFQLLAVSEVEKLFDEHTQSDIEKNKEKQDLDLLKHQNQYNPQTKQKFNTKYKPSDTSDDTKKNVSEPPKIETTPSSTEDQSNTKTRINSSKYSNPFNA